MSDAAHLLIPFAAADAPGGREALRGLALPRLQALLNRLAPAAGDDGDAASLSTPGERVLARACGLWQADGRIPWAAWQLQGAGRDPADAAWAWLTPCHWRVGRDHVRMDHPQSLQLDADESRAVLAAVLPYFEEDGITLTYEAPTLWLARGELFRPLACASLDRVVGRAVDAWLPRAPEARPVRRLQQEMQMLLYTHAVNEARERGGQLPVNSFWVSGAGALPAGQVAAAPCGITITHRLRDAAMQGDWAAWAAAWQALDAQEIAALLSAAERGDAVRITLCGEANARTWSSDGAGIWRRFTSVFRPQGAPTLLEQL